MVLVWTGGIYLATNFSNYVMDLLFTRWDIDGLLPEWGSFLGDIMYWTLWVLVRILLYLLVAFLSGNLVMVLMAPVFTFFSEQLSERMGVPSAPFNFGRFLLDLLRAIGVATMNGVLQISIAIGCFILSFIPVVGIAGPVILFLANSYFYGFNFMDYTLERKQLSIRESLSFAWRHKFTAVGLGLPFSLWMMVPFLGPLLSGFVALFGVCAATVTLEKRKYLDAPSF